MKTEAAVVYETGKPNERVELDLDGPEEGEVLELDELITRTCTLDQVDEGYDDLLGGKNVRGVLVHDPV